VGTPCRPSLGAPTPPANRRLLLDSTDPASALLEFMTTGQDIELPLGAVAGLPPHCAVRLRNRGRRHLGLVRDGLRPEAAHPLPHPAPPQGPGAGAGLVHIA
jgi:hypothetical protein